MATVKFDLNEVEVGLVHDGLEVLMSVCNRRINAEKNDSIRQILRSETLAIADLARKFVVAK